MKPEIARRKYKERKAAGICVVCGASNPEPKFSLCPECRRRARERERAARAAAWTPPVPLVNIGDRFGKRVVVAPDAPGRRGATYWLCRCDCGRVDRVAQIALRRGQSRACMSCSKRRPQPRLRGEHNYAWKGDAARHESKRGRAANYPRSGLCERCGNPGQDRHHRDGDPGNNDPRNVEFLCRRCHMAADGRLAALARYPRKKTHPRPCLICGSLRDKRRWHGRCHACNEYWRRHPGVERSVYLHHIRKSMEAS